MPILPTVQRTTYFFCVSSFLTDVFCLFSVLKMVPMGTWKMISIRATKPMERKSTPKRYLGLMHCHYLPQILKHAFFYRIITPILGHLLPTWDPSTWRNPWAAWTFKPTRACPMPTRSASTVRWECMRPSPTWWAGWVHPGAGWPRPLAAQLYQPTTPPTAHPFSRIFSGKWWVFRLAKRHLCCHRTTRTQCIALKRLIVICDYFLPAFLISPNLLSSYLHPSLPIWILRLGNGFLKSFPNKLLCIRIRRDGKQSMSLLSYYDKWLE